MKRVKHSWLLLLVLVTACRGMSDSGATCTSFIALQGKVGETFTLDVFRDWIGEQYALKKPSDIEVKIYSDLNANFLWQVDGYEYKAFVEDGEFRRLLISKKGEFSEIHASDMITCFGSPEFYRAVHALEVNAGDAQYFDLFFPSAGVVAHGYRNYLSKDHTTRPIQDDFPILNFSILQPGTVGEMLEQIYGSVAPFEYGAIRTWPNSWKDIVIDIAPEIQQLQNAP